MKVKLAKSALLALFLVFAAGNTALASKDKSDKGKKSSTVTVAEYMAAQDEIAMDIKRGRYGALPEEEIKLIQRNQATIRRIFKDVDSVDSLSIDDKIAAYNAQEAINSVLVDNVQERPVCRRQASTGTHMKRTICHTKRERGLMSDRAQESMRFWPVTSPWYGG